MSVTGSITKTMSIGKTTFNQASAPYGDGAIVQEVSVPAGDPGSLTTRTDNDTGAITLDESANDFEALDRVDVYWTGGCRRGMEVQSSVAGVVTIDGGDGDNLPDQDTEVMLIEPVALEINILGTLAQAIFLQTAKLGQFSFCDSGDTEHFHKELGAGKAYAWEEGDGTTNPITGDTIDKVYVSHGDASAATMKVGILHNNS